LVAANHAQSRPRKIPGTHLLALVVAEDKQDLAFVLGLLDSHVQRLVVEHLRIMAQKQYSKNGKDYDGKEMIVQRKS
jgi:hypothetical protein